jgi:hypothetical protein
VLSQATTGSVQQVSQLLSLSGTTLDLAATLLTVSLVDIESTSSTSETTSSAGPGPGQGSTQAKGSSGDPGDEPSEDAGEGDLISQAIMEVAPAWKRLAIGLSRSWERARAAILELDGRLPVAEGTKATAQPPVGRKPEPPVKAPARPTTKESTGAGAKPSPLSGAATLAPFEPEAATSVRGPKNTGQTVDAALAGLGTDREADWPLVRSGPRSWDGSANAQHPELTRALVATVAAAAVASTGWERKQRRAQFKSKAIHT